MCGAGGTMKLIIQIPCYNEAETLEIALNDLPKKIDGIDEIEYLIINDGSKDNTVQVAKDWGVHYVVNFKKNKGLAKGFMAGIDACLRNGADIIVNTDADNQYNGEDIEKLVRPILEEKADIVIGERPIDDTEHFSPLKKKLQHFGSWTVRVASKTDIPDAPSGFRAYSRDAAMRLNVTNEYTYTLETIIQALFEHVWLCEAFNGDDCAFFYDVQAAAFLYVNRRYLPADRPGAGYPFSGVFLHGRRDGAYSVADFGQYAVDDGIYDGDYRPAGGRHRGQQEAA